MRITIVTPLFPPDIGNPAPYVKALAGRLTDHEVSVVCFGRYPESVPNVSFYPIDKRARLISRLFKLTRLLLKLRKQTDVFYVQNGISVELPTILVSLFTRTPIVHVLSDERAAAVQTPIHQFIRLLLRKRVIRQLSILDQLPILAKPEILPFAEPPKQALATHEAAWSRHQTQLEETFTYVTA